MEYNKIVITTDGVTTKADEYIGKRLVKSALSKCSPDDTYDFPTGAKLAFERLMKPDKPTYKPGDKVRVSSKGQLPINCFNVGEVVTVVKYELNDYGCKRAVDGRFQLVNEDELEPYTEPAQPDKGEAVKLYCASVSDGNKHGFTVGKVYTLGEDGCITDDTGYTTLLHWTSYECLKGRMFPLIKRPAKVGEWVYITSNDVGGAKRGDVLRVVYLNAVNEHPYLRTEEDTIFGWDAIKPCTLTNHNNYLVLDGYQPEPEQPKYWSGKVVCVENMGCFHTKGKVYEVKNGIMNSDSGTYNDVPYTSVEDINENSYPQFVEFKG